MALEIVRKIVNGVWATVADDAAGGGGATPTLQDVLAEGNDAGGAYVLGVGRLAFDNGGQLYAQNPAVYGGAGRLSLTTDVAGAAQLIARGGAAGQDGGSARLSGGAADGFAADGASVSAEGGIAAGSVPGKLVLLTGGSTGQAGEAVVPTADGKAVWGGVSVAAEPPAAAPDGRLPFAYDTTPSTGGFYFWDGAAWVKIATIL